MASLSPNAKQQFFTNAAAPAAGCLLYTYATGTTTPLATYSDRAGTSANANPIVLDARGEATVYLLDQEYRYVLKSADGLTTFWTRDNVGSGQYEVRADLASSAAGYGAALVGYKRTGGVSRTVLSRILQQDITPEEFGAVGDGATNDYDAIVAAVSAAQTLGVPVRMTAAVYAIATPLVIQNAPVVLAGNGSKHPAYNGAAAAAGTSIKYIGTATSSAVVTFQHILGMHGLQGVSIDCNSLASKGLDIADTYYGGHADVSIRNVVSGGTAMRTGLSTSGSTNWNTFDRFSIDAIGAGGKGLHLTGTGPQNTAHNVFRDFQINYSGGATALHLGYSDNNSFHMLFINRTDATAGKGVYADPSESAAFPESNYFYHLQAGQDGWQQPAGTPVNYVFGYDRSNGQPLPSLGGTSVLVFTEGQNFWIGSNKLVKDADAWSESTAITVTPNSGAITTVGAKSCRYLVRGKTVYFHINVTITTNGTGAGYITIGNLPFTPGGSAGFIYMANGRAVGGAGAIMGTLVQGSTNVSVQTYSGAYPGVDGVTLALSGTCELA